MVSRSGLQKYHRIIGWKGEIIKRANVLGYPFNLLLDKDLNLIKAQPGHLNSDQIKQFVKE